MVIYDSVKLNFKIQASPFMKLTLYSQIQICKRLTAMVGKWCKIDKEKTMCEGVIPGYTRIRKHYYYYYYYYHSKLNVSLIPVTLCIF